MTAERPRQDVRQLLRSLGATENYMGFLYTAWAVQLSMDEPDRLRLVTKLLYPDVARRCSTTWKAVERSIRTVVSVVWTSNPQLLCRLAGFRLSDKPNNARFLAIVASACTQGAP